MSWIKQARRDYLASLIIKDDMIAYVEFSGEPQTRTQGKKQLRSGEEVDDVRVFAKIKYIGGSARAKQGKEDSYPAVQGDEYTLWMSSTLNGRILDVLGYESGDPPPLMGKKFKIWRSEERRGGNRIYECELLSNDFTFDKSSSSSNILKETKKVEAKKATKPSVGDDSLINTLTEKIKLLDEIDKDTWYVFVINKGAKDQTDAERITNIMKEKGLIDITATSVKAK